MESVTVEAAILGSMNIFLIWGSILYGGNLNLS